jgi:NTP pyrophosphatase (non-canonical NTP hydrolase)
MYTPLNELARVAHANSVSKGWWESDRNFGETLTLIHQELSEAFEEYRQGREFTEVYYKPGTDGKMKPEGIPVELADVIIRILDFAGSVGIDLDSVLEEKMKYNATRPYRHGNLKA